MPHPPKDHAARSGINSTRISEKKEASPDSGDIVDVECSHSTNSPLITPTADMSIKTEALVETNVSDDRIRCSLLYDSDKIQLFNNQPMANAEPMLTGIGGPVAPLHDMNAQYQFDVGDSSHFASRPLSQASHTQNLIPLIPIGHRPSASDTHGDNTRMVHDSARLPGDEQRSSHGRPGRLDQAWMYHQNRAEPSRCINPTDTYTPSLAQVDCEARSNGTRSLYSYSGVDRDMAPTTEVGGAYSYLAPPQPPPSHPVQQGPVSSRTEASTGYPIYEASVFNNAVTRDRTYLLEKDWYSTSYDTEPPPNMMAQSYNLNADPNILLPQQPMANSLHADQQSRALVAQEWHAIAAGNGYAPEYGQ